MTLAAGSRLGPYEILAPLGAGGMGEVYRARDTRLGREVAVKVIADPLAGDANRMRRFDREARTAGALAHPNLLTIHDVGTFEGRPYIVSELLEGSTLREALTGGGLPPRKAVEYAIQIAEGLAAAHEKAIIHRDIKPENLFLTRDGRMKILDFGLATAESSPDVRVTATHQTAPHALLGTVGYISPEQLAGRPADARSDLFALGAVLYEMLTGRRAFSGPTSVDVLHAILNRDPTPVGQGVPDPIVRIVQRCLEKRPEDRFQSARDLAFALQAMHSAEPTAAEPTAPGPSSPANGRAVARQGSVGRGLALALVAIAALAFAWSRWVGRTSPSEGTPTLRSLAVLPLTNLSQDPAEDYFVDGMTDALITDLGKISSLRVISRTSVMRYKETRKPLPEIAHDLRVDALVEGSVARSGDRVRITANLVQASPETQLWAESYERDLRDVLSLQRDVARAIAHEIRARLTPQERSRLATGRAVDSEVYLLYLKGRFFWNRRTEEDLNKAVAYLEQAIDRDPRYAPAYAGLADAYIAQGYLDFVPPKEVASKAKAAALKALEIDESLAEAHTSLGAALEFHDRDWVGAEREFRRAIELNPNYATAHHWYAQLLAPLGRTEEYLAESRRALELDPLSLIISASLASRLYYARRYDDAIEQLRKTLELDESFVIALGALGQAYEAKGAYEHAIGVYQKAALLSGDSPSVIASLARAYALSGNEREARRLLDRLSGLSQSRYVSPFDVAKVHASLGDEDAAFRWLDRAYEDRSNRLAFVNVDPTLDSLRSDPRFDELLFRMGLRTHTP